MSMLLNEEQTLLKSSAAEFFAAKSPVKSLRALRDAGDPVGFDRALWREMAEMGWAGILIPEDHGGVDFGYKGLGQVLEEAGRSLVASPLESTVLLASPYIRAAGTPAQQRALLPGIATGELIVSLALDEHPRHAPWQVAARAERRDGKFILNGRKCSVLDGHVADHLIVVARTAGDAGARDGLSAFLVPRGAAGLACERTPMVDSRNAANLTLQDVAVTADALLGPPGGAADTLEHVLDGARVGLAAQMLGSGLEAFERTVKYLKLRTQFGVVIGSFQALKHRAALMYCELELTVSAVLEALTALDEARADVPELASLAKAQACEMLELVTSEAIQLHGGIGMTDAEEIGFFLKRARVAQQLFGDAGFHRDRYASRQGF